jgi:hypothetical protein
MLTGVSSLSLRHVIIRTRHRRDNECPHTSRSGFSFAPGWRTDLVEVGVQPAPAGRLNIWSRIRVVATVPVPASVQDFGLDLDLGQGRFEALQCRSAQMMRVPACPVACRSGAGVDHPVRRTSSAAAVFADDRRGNHWLRSLFADEDHGLACFVVQNLPAEERCYLACSGV